jgi:hypothetical protein
VVRYFYDNEFLEDGRIIDPISIGIVSDDGREYYAINGEAPWEKIRQHAWLMANVVPHLPPLAREMIDTGRGFQAGHPLVKPRWKIAAEVSEFIREGGEDRDQHDLVAYYGAYDHVVLCQLWGRMIDLPPWVPMFTHDLKSMSTGLEQVGHAPRRPKPSIEHHALADARWNQQYWDEQVAATVRYLRSLNAIPDGHITLAAPTAARLIERMFSVGPNEGVSEAEKVELLTWWEDFVYPPGEPEAGDVFEAEEVSDEEQARLEAQQDVEDTANDEEHARRLADTA